MRSGSRLLGCAGIGLLAAPQPAQAELPGLRSWAEAVTAAPRRTGPLRPFPATPTRPVASGGSVRSSRLPLVVNAAAGAASSAAESVLAELEWAYTTLRAGSWPLPLADGGAGKSLGFDLYLRPRVPGVGQAGLDPRAWWVGLDTAPSFALMQVGIDGPARRACVLSVLAQAALWGQDPAESEGWRVATAGYLAWQATGQLGCEPQLGPEAGRSWLEGNRATAPWLVALLSERADGGDGSFMRELWQFARQRTASGSQVRARPDLWAALDKALGNANESLERWLDDFAIERFFAGSDAAASRFLRTLDPQARPRPLSRLSLRELPAHLWPKSIQVLGSRYVVVDTGQSNPGSELRVWLRGETGVRWSLAAVRLDRHGRELGRVRAPARTLPRAYLPVVLTPRTDRVVLVATNLGHGVASYRDPTRLERAFGLVVAQAPEN